MNSLLIYPIALPLAAGLICLLLPKRVRYVREIVSLGVSIATLVCAFAIYQQGALKFQMGWFAVAPYLQVSIDLLATPLARLGVMAAAIFAILICAYSWEFMRQQAAQGLYYAGLMAALGASCGVLLSNNFILFLFCWEIVGIMLYMLVMISGADPANADAAPAAGKALIIAVTGDMALLLGVAFFWLEKGSLTISDLAANPLKLNTPLSIAAFGLMLVAAMAKAGVIPLHSWLPAISTHTHMPVMSFFTSLDKIIGIYLLASLSLFWFVMTPQVGMLLMILGAVSLLAGVLMAMIQHDFRKMLAFHNVSQVGYMVLGIGTGTALGIIGGLFHLVNMLVLKGSLFLCGGSVQRQTGRTEFAELGGLARSMPWTFVGTLVAALGISGIPPLNAFVSKWMIYQGIISQGSGAFPIFLMVAMFGSALTLASFMKLMYSIFWGNRPEGLEQVKESGAAMLIPIVFLALAAIGFGVFYFWPTNLLAAAVGPLTSQVPIPGFWDSGLAAILLIVSLLAGLPIYWLSRTRETREAEVFLGGETLDPELYRVPGSHFYGPVKEFAGLKQLFALGEKGKFDLYNYFIRGVNWAARIIYQYFDQALGDFYQEVIPSLLSLLGQILRELNSRLVLTYIMWFLYAAAAFGMWLRPEDANIAFTARIIACIGMVGWAVLAAVETDLRRLLTLAATSQFGFVLLGLSFSINVAVSYLITGSFALAVLFLIGYLISQAMKTTDINGMNGLAARMPVHFLFFMLAALWLSGLPPFGSFFSKYLLGVAAGQISPFLTIVITGTALLTLGYLLRPIRRFLRPV
jgi:formate hydrogenlyase subunit 3/multisubunit Na+/H+ antiporter MnhD subunit